MTDRTGRAAARDDWPALVRAVVAAGVDWVQVRDRSLPAELLRAFVAEVLVAAREGAAERGGEATVLVNRRVDVALSTGAGGVHLGFDACSPAEARRLLTELGGAMPALVGVAAHAPEEVAAAAAAGADYAHLAPIFDPLSKPRERPALGTAGLARASEVLGTRGAFRLLAQGGIDAMRAAEAIRAGADGVAVTGALLGGTHREALLLGGTHREALREGSGAAGPAAAADAAARLRATLDAAARGGG